MKIAVVLESSDPLSGGGFTFQEDLFMQIAENHLHLKNEYCIFLSKKQMPKVSNNIKKIEIIPFKITLRDKILRLLRRNFKWPRLLFKIKTNLEKKLRRNQIDICLFITPQMNVVEYPYVTIVWDLEHRISPFFPEVSSGGEWDAREKGNRNVLQRAMAIIIGSDVGKNEIEKSYGIFENRIWKLPHPTPRFAIIPNRAENPSEKLLIKIKDKKFLFYPAQFWAHKNHFNLILAFKKVVELKKDVYLVLTGGDKGNLHYIKSIVLKEKLEDRVIFSGFVSRVDLYYLYKNAIALIYPSFCGPENLPPLEAMALNCLVLASDISGAREQLNGCFIGFNPYSIDDMANTISRILINVNTYNEIKEIARKRSESWTSKEFVENLDKRISLLEPLRKTWFF
jgi:glycosyltransferase involved in cell wall biosynthesis